MTITLSLGSESLDDGTQGYTLNIGGVSILAKSERDRDQLADAIDRHSADPVRWKSPPSSVSSYLGD